MTEHPDWKQFIVFNEEKFTAERQKDGGRPAEAILGIVRAPDDFHARDTAGQIFPDTRIFVKDYDTAEPEYASAGDKMGYLNTSQAHRH